MSGYRSDRCECLATGLEDVRSDRCESGYRSDRCECLATGLEDVSVWLQV